MKLYYFDGVYYFDVVQEANVKQKWGAGSNCHTA